MNGYEAKQEARRERLMERAAKKEAESNARHEEAHRMMDVMQGEPVKVGHHSARRHRRDIERVDTHMRKAIENSKEAEDLRRRADAVGTGGISSDDPDAIEKLEAKIARLEARREVEKKANAVIRKAAKAAKKRLGRELGQADHLALIPGLDLDDETKSHLASAARCFPWLPQFAGHTATEVRRLKKRIEELRARDAAPEVEPVLGNGWIAEEDREANRVRIYFDARPDGEMRAWLKSRGFRWSPNAGAWQRAISPTTWALVDQLRERTSET